MTDCDCCVDHKQPRTTVLLISTIWTVLDAVAVCCGWQAGVIGAEEAFTLSSL